MQKKGKGDFLPLTKSRVTVPAALPLAQFQNKKVHEKNRELLLELGRLGAKTTASPQLLHLGVRESMCFICLTIMRVGVSLSLSLPHSPPLP